MKWCKAFLSLAVLAVFAMPTPAGGIFGKRSVSVPGNPTDRVRHLIQTLGTNGNANARSEAAADLRVFDASAHPEIIPTLVNSLRSDPSLYVRIEAARSLGRVRPLTSMAGDALAEASTGDSAFRVRWQARASLMVYTVAGINPGNHAPQNPQNPKVTTNKSSQGNPYSSGSGQAQGQIYVPFDKKDILVPPADGYARPLPKGPQGNNGSTLSPQNVPVVPVTTPDRPTTAEPPLANGLPPFIQPPPAPNPTPAPAHNIQTPPTLLPEQGPILTPPL